MERGFIQLQRPDPAIAPPADGRRVAPHQFSPWRRRYLRTRYRFSFQQVVVELLSKRWMDPIIPFAVMVGVIVMFGALLPGYLSTENIADTSRQFAELGFVVFAMLLVVVVGGIDLSVGSMFALADFAALMAFDKFGWPVGVVIPAVMAFGAVLGAVNGVLIGFLKTRAFLTTLVTLIIYRAAFDLLTSAYAADLATGARETPLWTFLGGGTLFGIPTNCAALIAAGAVGYVLLSRSRPGWHLVAIGAGRRAARHAGIPVEPMVFLTYVFSGMWCALAGAFYAARLNSAGSDTGQGLEILAITAVVLGGVSLGGGKGSVGRALIGATTVLVLTNGLVRLGIEGGASSVALGGVLLLAVGFDVKWAKNRHKAIQKLYVVPTYLELPPCPDTSPEHGGSFAMNDRLRDAEAIGLDQVEGPEDVILDRQGRVYGGTRQGWIIRFSGEHFENREVFARPGGRPLGMAFDKDDNLIVCIGGMGLYGIRPNAEVYRITDETNRSWNKINDDSRLRLTDDCDIAPDGKIYFSEATIRYEMHSWPTDALEGRGNGRLCCYDPATGKTHTAIKDLVFPNGVCVSHDGRSVLIAQTWLCRIIRYWIAGPRTGEFEVLVPALPGYPDNINRASDGNYWLALVGMRTPTYDLSMKMPGFRSRMVKRIPPDEWMYPNLNNGCIVKFNDKGEVSESLWDPGGKSHPTICSMREDHGYLYISGLSNNRIGRIPIPGADPNWNGPEAYWGKR